MYACVHILYIAVYIWAIPNIKYIVLVIYCPLRSKHVTGFAKTCHICTQWQTTHGFIAMYTSQSIPVNGHPSTLGYVTGLRTKVTDKSDRSTFGSAWCRGNWLVY